MLCCQLLSALACEGWSVSSCASLDSMCIYQLPEELYPVTTWFFNRISPTVQPNGAPTPDGDEDEEYYPS